MRAAKTTIRFKLSRAEDARALEYLRDRKAAGSSFSKSVVQAINDCLDAQEAESREEVQETYEKIFEAEQRRRRERGKGR